MPEPGAHEVLALLRETGVVPVIRVPSAAMAYEAVRILAGVGFPTAEITMTVPGAADVIRELSRDAGLVIGAGTVLDAEQADAMIRAGARYVVSPCIVEGVAERCREAGVLCILSGLTPGEVFAAWRRGSGAVKVFPAASVGGPEYVRALKAVFPGVPLVPTGGVTLDNVADYLRSGAAFVGVGSDLVNASLLESGQEEAVADAGRRYLQAVAEVRQGG